MNPRNSIKVILPAAVVLALALLPLPAAGQAVEEPAADEHAGHQMHEGAITFSGQGQEHSTKALGGIVGNETVEKIGVGVFVLQAESPDRLKTGGSGPTHLFNVTLTDMEQQELIRQATGTVTVTGSDGRQRKEEIRPFASHFQVQVRLEQPGEYLVRVEFEADGRSGKTGTMPFTYRRKDTDADAGHEDHEDHEGHEGQGDHADHDD